MSYGNSQKWYLEMEEARPLVNRALDLGINFFDTANVYSRGRSEEITGRLLEGHRDDVVLATKVRFAMGEGVNDKGLNRYHMHREIRRSLERLGTDYVDLYQIHRYDNSVSAEHLMRSLNRVVEDGLALHIGASSMYAWQLAKLQFTAEKLGLEKFTTMQNHYNAIYREEEREVIPFCIDQDMGIIPWSPLGRGFLSGKYTPEKAEGARLESDPYLRSRYFRENDFEVLAAVREVAIDQGISVAQAALAWVLSRDGVTSPIVGITRMQHLEEAVEATEIQLKHDEVRRIDDPYVPHPIIGHSYDQPDTMINSKS